MVSSLADLAAVVVPAPLADALPLRLSLVVSAVSLQLLATIVLA
jgi:hypothetical protein